MKRYCDCTTPDIITFKKIGGRYDGKWKIKCDSCKSFLQPVWFNSEADAVNAFHMDNAIIACSELNASDLVEMFEDVLEKIGYNVYEHPDFEGSDMVGFVVSKAKLTKKQLKEFSEEYD